MGPWLLKAISDHKNSALYKTALIAREYAEGRNVTIVNYQKFLYTVTGEAVPDNYTANHKCASAFLKIFTTQEISTQLGNGVSFGKDETKKKLGRNLDSDLYKAGKSAVIDGVVFGFFNLDHIQFFWITEYVPLQDEKTGGYKAGIRFTQIDSNHPMCITLFEEDGYTEYVKEDGKNIRVDVKKRPYILHVTYSEADGEQVKAGYNYPTFPVVPLWGNHEHQSSLSGLREQIDCYDLIKSGFANDVDEASLLYWTVSGASGDDLDLAKFVERMKTLRAAFVGDKDDMSDKEPKVESHAVDVPYQSRQVYLEMLKDDLYRFAMALDVDKIAGGTATTATQIRAAYQLLDEKCDELEMNLFDFFHGIFTVAGIDDEPQFTRSYIVNQSEATEMVLSASQYLDQETIVRKLPFLSKDEQDDVLLRLTDEQADRYKQMEAELEEMKNQQTNPGKEDEEE